MGVSVEGELVGWPQRDLLLLLLFGTELASHPERRQIAPYPEHVLLVLEAIGDILVCRAFFLNMALLLRRDIATIVGLLVQRVVSVVEPGLLHVHIL